MPDEKPSGSFSLDNLLKVANFLIILGVMFTGFQKTSSNGEFTASQVTQLRSDLKDQSERMRELEGKFARLEQQVADLVETIKQDQRYRSATQK